MSLPQEAPPPIIGSNGPLSNPTLAVQPDRGHRVFMPHYGHCLRSIAGTRWVESRPSETRDQLLG
jgi:hypothetical protein